MISNQNTRYDFSFKPRHSTQNTNEEKHKKWAKKKTRKLTRKFRVSSGWGKNRGNEMVPFVLQTNSNQSFIRLCNFELTLTK